MFALIKLMSVGQDEAVMSIVYAVRTLITLYAVYLNFKCNKSFYFWPFVASVVFSEIYIVYKYATQRSCMGVTTPRTKTRSKTRKRKK